MSGYGFFLVPLDLLSICLLFVPRVHVWLLLLVPHSFDTCLLILPPLYAGYISSYRLLHSASNLLLHSNSCIVSLLGLALFWYSLIRSLISTSPSSIIVTSITTSMHETVVSQRPRTVVGQASPLPNSVPHSTSMPSLLPSHGRLGRMEAPFTLIQGGLA